MDFTSRFPFTHLKNSDTDKNAKVALNEMYCGNGHFRWLLLSIKWCPLMKFELPPLPPRIKSPSLYPSFIIDKGIIVVVGGFVVKFVLHGWSERHVN